MVALTTLDGLLEPSDLLKMSLIPAASSTARTFGPAMMPVPGEAGRNITLAPPYSQKTAWGMVASFKETVIIRVLAISPPLRMASETSTALPRPRPMRPCLSPATTSALKLKRRPPLTTFAERLMKTTFSLNSEPPPDSSVGSPPSGEPGRARRGPRLGPRPPPPPPPLALPLELLLGDSGTVFFLKG